ncbi:MAG TPA: DUF2911 domain-containing protein [Cyclobacteriaceae bacterium]|nr:DUF2911 domain-containing protein [Cyclobacteriaceae bacterium]
MRLWIALFSFCLATGAFAQINVPPLSPKFEVKGTVGFAEVKVVYSRPSARGRKVAGNLIPYNEVWRTGANESTKISFSEEVKIEGHILPAGDYALYTIFTEDKATIIFSKNLELWGAAGYDASQDALRFEVPVKHPSSHYETFTISFSDFTHSSANLNLKWEHTKAMFKIESEVDARIMKDIQDNLIAKKSSDPNTLYDGADYYYETSRDSKQALEWINQAIALSKKDQYWMWYLKAKLLARMNNKAETIAVATKARDLAEAAQNFDYVRLNEQLIASMK